MTNHLILPEKQRVMSKDEILSNWIYIGEGDTRKNEKLIINKENTSVGAIGKVKFNRKLYRAVPAVLDLLRQ